MALAYDAKSNSGEKTSGSSITVSHTCTGTKLLLLVGVGNTTETVTGVTYNAVALTKLDSTYTTGENCRCEVWYLINPATGAHNIVASFGGSITRGGMGAVSFTGVDQYNPFNTHAISPTNSDGVPSTSVSTTTPNTYLIDFAYFGSSSTAMNGSQTNICLFTISSQDAFGGSYKAQAATGSGSMDWTVSQYHAQVVAAIQETQPRGSFILNMI